MLFTALSSNSRAVANHMIVLSCFIASYCFKVYTCVGRYVVTMCEDTVNLTTLVHRVPTPLTALEYPRKRYSVVSLGYCLLYYWQINIHSDANIKTEPTWTTPRTKWWCCDRSEYTVVEYTFCCNRYIINW